MGIRTSNPPPPDVSKRPTPPSGPPSVSLSHGCSGGAGPATARAGRPARSSLANALHLLVGTRVAWPIGSVGTSRDSPSVAGPSIATSNTASPRTDGAPDGAAEKEEDNYLDTLAQNIVEGHFRYRWVKVTEKWGRKIL